MGGELDTEPTNAELGLEPRLPHAAICSVAPVARFGSAIPPGQVPVSVEYARLGRSFCCPLVGPLRNEERFSGLETSRDVAASVACADAGQGCSSQSAAGACYRCGTLGRP